MGLRSVTGDNNFLADVIEIRFKSQYFFKNVIVMKIEKKEEISKTISGVSNISRSIMLHIFNIEGFDGEIIDSFMKLKYFSDNIECEPVKIVNSLAAKISLSKASPEILFIKNFMSLNGYAVVENKVVELATGRVVFGSRKEFLDSWEMICDNICQKFNFESIKIDRLLLKESFIRNNSIAVVFNHN